MLLSMNKMSVMLNKHTREHHAELEMKLSIVCFYNGNGSDLSYLVTATNEPTATIRAGADEIPYPWCTALIPRFGEGTMHLSI